MEHKHFILLDCAVCNIACKESIAQRNRIARACRKYDLYAKRLFEHIQRYMHNTRLILISLLQCSQIYIYIYISHKYIHMFMCSTCVYMEHKLKVVGCKNIVWISRHNIRQFIFTNI